MAWLDTVIGAFQVISTSHDPAKHGPYNQVMYTLFPVGSGFIVFPTPLPDPQNPSQFIFNYEVRFRNRPVLVVALKEASNLQNISKRKDADMQIRTRLAVLAGEWPVLAVYVTFF
jgi:hypothetical protein